MEFIYYLLKVSVCLFLFSGSYMLFLKKLSFFKTNRIYLLATLFLSFIIPYLRFQNIQNIKPVRFFDSYNPVEQITSKSLAPIIINNELSSLSVSDLFLYLYLLITIVLLWRGFSKVYQLIEYVNVDFELINNLKVIYKETGFVNCSFFNYVFIDKTSLTIDEMQILLKHEEVHARQFHTIDKLILLVFKAFLWFNPVIYWYERMLEEVHEFEADAITANVFPADLYASLLIEMATKKQSDLILHSFSKHPLKARIARLFTAVSATRLKWSYLTIIPSLICLSWLFAFKAPDVSLKTMAENSNFVLVLDAGHGGYDQGAEGGGFLEKDLTLLLMQKVIAIAKEKNLKVITTRNADEYMSLKNRARPKGDLLVSLHVNQHVDAKINGIELLLGNTDQNKVKSEKLNEISYQLYKNLSRLKGIATDNVPREVKGLYLLDKSSAPALILELGYLTNENDRNYLTDPMKQDELASAIVSSVLDYHHTLNNKEK